RDLIVRSDNSLVTATTEGPGANLVSYGADGAQLSISATQYPLITSARIEGFALALQPDNKVLLAGRISYALTGWTAYRWNADGKVDEDFDTSGLTSPNDGSQATADALAVLPGGGLLVSGVTGTASYQSVVFHRAADGSVDTAFAGSGRYAAPGFVLPEHRA